MAAPGNSSTVTTDASWAVLRSRSVRMYKSAPEITPVSYPNSNPPNVEITVNLIRNRLCLAVEAVPAPGPAEPTIGFLLLVSRMWGAVVARQ